MAIELIIKGAPELGETISTAIEGIEKDPLVLDELLLPLTRYSLISRDASTYSIHRLVQAVNRAFPHVEFQNWHLCDRMLPHAQMCARLIEDWGFKFQEAALLLNQTGLYLHNLARYAEAEAQEMEERVRGIRGGLKKN